MKKLLLLAGLALMVCSASAKKPAQKTQEEGYKFTDLTTVPTTSVKDQHRSGTCWCYSALSFLENEILRAGGPEMDLSEMWIVRNMYFDKGVKYVRLHGHLNFAEGGAAHDVIEGIKKYGIVPQEVYPGLNYGTEKPVFGELDAAHNTQLDDAEIATQAARIIAEKVPANNTPEVKKFLFNCIDLTTLNSTDSDESVMKFTQKVNKFDEEFPDLKNVAAICVYPNFAEVVKDTLEVEDVKIACVSAGFPSSQTFIEVKVAETAMALMEGADEIDIVISVGKFLAGDYEGMCEEIQELKATCKEHHMKVILETGALKTASNHQKSIHPFHVFGCRFHQDSTGKQQPAATPEAPWSCAKPSRNITS